MPGKSLATFFASSRKRPSVARTTFALWTTVTFFRPLLLRELEGGADDSLRALLRVDLAGDRVLVAGQVREVREGLRESRQRRRELGRHRVELHARVEVLGVLAEDHEVDPLLVVQGIARVALDGPQADVEVEELAHPDDGRAVGEALAPELRGELGLGRLHGLRRDRAEEGRVHVLQQLDRAGRKGIAFLAPEVPADVAVDVLGVQLDPVQDEPRRLHHVVADAVAGQPGDAELAHEHASGAQDLPIPAAMNGMSRKPASFAPRHEAKETDRGQVIEKGKLSPAAFVEGLGPSGLTGGAGMGDPRNRVSSEHA